MLKTLARFAQHLAGRRPVLALLFALGLVGAAVSLATPLLGKAFIDAVATRGDYAIIPAIAAALVGLALLDLLLAVVSQRLHARLSADVLAALRAMLFARCANGPLEAIEPIRHGDLLTRFGTDLPRIQTLLVDGLLGALQSLLFLAVAAAITFTLSPLLALWSFLGLALALAATTAFRRPMEGRAERVREAMSALSHFLAERLAALRAMRLHRSAEEELQRLTQANARLTHEVVGMQQLDALSSGVPGLLLTLSLAWIYLIGGRLLEAGTISLGTFVAFVLYQGRLFAPAQGLLGLVRNLQTARVSIDRVVELLDDEAMAATAAITPPAAQPTPAARSQQAANVAAPVPAIECEGVDFAYPGKPALLRGLGLVMQPGERVALAGASGAGKSTLVQLLFGLRTPAAGRVRVEGQPAGRAGEALGYAGAEPFLMHASVEENLRYGNPGARRDALERAVRLAEADAFIDALPQGMATLIGGRGLALSDGQRQRLGLARLFLRDPRILVLDEAFSALDLQTEERVRAKLWQAFAGRSVIIISHRAVGLDEFDRVLVLRDGRLEAAAPGEARQRPAAAAR
ncbi:MAG: hypothetical protein ABS84_11740 [Rubrivivax sp. SCN 71-131]|nr:MAG: hypothetical protein ABS84_11740 [Rubrivivax sp. SCN 71-131]